MKIKSIIRLWILTIALFAVGCTPALLEKNANDQTPGSYGASTDTLNDATKIWKEYFSDPFLLALIDTALINNRELHIAIQEIEIARSEVMSRKAEYLPFVGVGAGAGTEKVGRYTSQGANDANTDIRSGQAFPDPLPDFQFGAYATWEIDVWKKLRNAKKAAVARYLGSIEGQNFMVTNLVAEIANSYYELLALDSQLEILKQNIAIQSNALAIVRLQKESVRVTELAVRRFEAQVFNTRSMQFSIEQRIVETENQINFLVGRFPQRIERNSQNFTNMLPPNIFPGVPAQLLENRPDVRQAEFELAASKLDIKVAKAQFYPSIGINAGVGFRAFDPSYLIKTPESLIYSLTGDLMAPLINRKAIKALYFAASAKQLQAVYNYEQTIINAYMEVANQISNINNLDKSYDLKAQEVNALKESIEISNNLFSSARADYMEVLLTQRDALESTFELIETKKEQMHAVVNIYQALGGGWR